MKKNYAAPSMKIYKIGVHCLLANSITSVAPTSLGEPQMEDLGGGSTTVDWDWN